MDKSHLRSNFQQIRNIVEEQIRLQTQSGNKSLKYGATCAKEPTPAEIQPPRLSVLEMLPMTTENCYEKNKSDTKLNFKITGKTFYKVVDLLTEGNIYKRKNESNVYPIYDYLPTNVLFLSLDVRNDTSRCFTERSSFANDAYMNPRQCDVADYVNMNEKSDLTKVTVIKDYSFNGIKELHTVRVGSRIYYDRHQNPRIERNYTSVIDENVKTTAPDYQKTISEIIQSEYSYVTGLHYIYHNYVLHFRGESSNSLCKVDPFFRMLEQIYLQQSEFYKKMISYKSIEDISSHFVENEKLFHMYTDYIINLNSVHRYLSLDYRFEILKRQQELGNQTSLEDYLLSPVQRLNKYMLLLEQLESHLQRKFQTSSKIAIILSVIKKLLISSKAAAKIVDSILHRPPSLINYGAYIMKDSFYVRKINNSAKLTVFLFQEVIIFSILEESDLYAYKHSILMKDLYMRVVADNPISFEVTEFHTTKDKKNMYVLETVDPRTKEIWVEVIESLLWEQLIFCKNKLDGDNIFKEKLV